MTSKRVSVAGQLADLVVLYAECARSPERPAAVRARTRILDVLSTWCELLVTNHAQRRPAARTVADLAFFLQQRFPLLAGADDFAEDVGAAVAMAWAVVRADRTTAQQPPEPLFIRRTSA